MFVAIEEKVSSFGKFGASIRGPGGPRPHVGLQKILFLEHYATTRKPKMMQKGILTFHPTYFLLTLAVY